MRPVLKWVGGKTKMLPEIIRRFPRNTKGLRYCEPFLGGGAVFFDLGSDDYHFGFREHCLSDSNPELVSFYLAVRDDAVGVTECYQQLLAEYGQDPAGTYEKARWRFNTRPDWLSTQNRAAHFLLLNKTCFNGIWRVDGAGKFNTPWGKRPVEAARGAVQLVGEAAAALRNATLVCCDFLEAMAGSLAAPDTFWYIDPPYLPRATGGFSTYTPGGFGLEQHSVLADRLRDLDKAGAKFLLNNTDCPEARTLYERFCVESVQRVQTVAADASVRRVVSDLVVRNYT